MGPPHICVPRHLSCCQRPQLGTTPCRHELHTLAPLLPFLLSSHSSVSRAVSLSKGLHGLVSREKSFREAVSSLQEAAVIMLSYFPRCLLLTTRSSSSPQYLLSGGCKCCSPGWAWSISHLQALQVSSSKQPIPLSLLHQDSGQVSLTPLAPCTLYPISL